MDGSVSEVFALLLLLHPSKPLVHRPPLPLQDRCCCEGLQDEEEQEGEGLSEVEVWLLTGFIGILFDQQVVSRFPS